MVSFCDLFVITHLLEALHHQQWRRLLQIFMLQLVLLHLQLTNVISGGYSAGGISNNAKKLYGREVLRVETKRPRRNSTTIISFSDDDYTENMIED